MSKREGRLNLIVDGKDNWENTNDFEKKVHDIRLELSEKYSLILSAEKSWFKRLLIKIRQMIEMNKRVDELSSWKNLHVCR